MKQLVTGIAAILLVSCAQSRTLRPAPEARIAADPYAAAASAAGVHVKVEAGAWSGFPADIEDHVTPLYVTIENDGQVPLRIRFAEMGLLKQDGERLAALPPAKVEGTEVVAIPMDQLDLRYDAFFFAPYYRPLFPQAPLWAHPFPYDMPYYDTWFPRWRVDLPTADMVRKALPEGAMEKGRVSGFVYFEPIDDRVQRISFQLDLVNAMTGQPFGRIEVPFVVEEQ